MGSTRIDDMVPFVLVAIHSDALGVRDYPTVVGCATAMCAGKKWRVSTAITEDEMVELLRLHWTSADVDEARQVVDRLQSLGKLRRVGSNWKIIRSPKPLPEQQFIPFKPPNREKIKPGNCRKCEAPVRNTNRHNNKSHSVDSCRFHVVKRILTD